MPDEGNFKMKTRLECYWKNQDARQTRILNIPSNAFLKQIFVKLTKHENPTVSEALYRHFYHNSNSIISY